VPNVDIHDAALHTVTAASPPRVRIDLSQVEFGGFRPPGVGPLTPSSTPSAAAGSSGAPRPRAWAKVLRMLRPGGLKGLDLVERER
jgi:hypothetical protein